MINDPRRKTDTREVKKVMRTNCVRCLGLPVALLMIIVGLAGAQTAAGPDSPDGRMVSIRDLAGATASDERVAFDLAQAAEGAAAGSAAGGQTFGAELTAEERMDIFDRPVFNQIVTLKAKDAQFQNILRLIAEKTELNILLDPDEIDGNKLITFNLRNVPLGYALDNILKTHKLAYIIEPGDILRIVPESRVGREEIETVTEIIELNWRDAKDIQKTFNAFVTNNGKMVANDEAQSVIITDVPPNVIKIRSLITQIDRPERQVVIEARLLDIQSNAGKNLGVNWEGNRINKDFTDDISDGDFTQVGVPIVTSSTSSTGVVTTTTTPTVVGLLDENLADPTFLADTGEDFLSAVTEGASFINGGGFLQFSDMVGIFGDTYNIDMQITAAEQRGFVEVLANPRVTTLNNVRATIDIVQRIPYRQGDIGSGGTTVIRISFEDAGVKIDVLPIITPDGHVRMEVKLNQEIFRGRVGNDPLGLAPPLMDERTTFSTVIVLDGHTVVLGGLRGLERNESLDGIPWLHRIPLFGWLFKVKNYEQNKTELVLMVTPHIVEEALLNDVEKEMYDRIDVNWHLPDWFFDDVNSPYDK